MSLKLKILEEITKAYPNTYGIDEVFGIAALLGHKQSLAERKCRELVHAGLIEVIKDERGYNKAYKALDVSGLFKVVPITEYVKSNEYKEIQRFIKDNDFNLNGKIIKNGEVKPTQSRLGIKLPPINL